MSKHDAAICARVLMRLQRIEVTMYWDGKRYTERRVR
jgi:hypothetical protein